MFDAQADSKPQQDDVDPVTIGVSHVEWFNFLLIQQWVQMVQHLHLYQQQLPWPLFCHRWALSAFQGVSTKCEPSPSRTPKRVWSSRARQFFLLDLHNLPVKSSFCWQSFITGLMTYLSLLSSWAFASKSKCLKKCILGLMPYKHIEFLKAQSASHTNPLISDWPLS